MELSSKKLIFTAAFAALFALLTRTYFIETFRIPTQAMMPTLNPGDIAVVNKLSYGFRSVFIGGYWFHWSQVERGDIVVFPLPDDPNRLFVKRVAGIPGDEVRISNQGQIHINGQKIIVGGWSLPTDFKKFGPIKVSDGEVFVLGDSRDKGTDSRHWGSVPIETVIGKVSWVVTKGWFQRPIPADIPIELSLNP